MCRPTDWPIVLVGMLTNSQATYWSIGYQHSANTSLIRYNIILRLLKFLFCPWFILCSYGILCNLCTCRLSICRCYWLILDRHVGWDVGQLLVAISADSQSTWLTLVGWLSVDMLVDGQIGGLCFFLLLLFHLLHLFQSTTITIIITKHTCTHGLHTQAHMQFYNHYTMVLVGMLTDSRQTLMGYWHSADTLLILSQWYILCLLKL